MSIPFKLHKTLSIEISHYISCKDNDCERIYSDIELQMHYDICPNYEEVSQEEYINQEDIQT